MARIKINDLRSDVMISKEEMKMVFGGATNEDLTNYLGFNSATTIISSLSWGAMTEDPTEGGLIINSIGTRLGKF